MANKNDSFVRTVGVALAVCLVASVIVSFTAVQLQETNKLLDKQSNILAVAGFDLSGKSGSEIAELFVDSIETRIVNIGTGSFSDEKDAATYDQRQAAKDPAQNVELSTTEDTAKIKRRAKFASTYIVKAEDGSVKYYILPVHGYGLWSTLYGFVAVEADANTIFGLSFYSHAETPGLGGEVDNPKWKKIQNAQGETAIQVVKFGAFRPDAANAINTVDGLAGASLTTQGVNNLVQYWLGDAGFGPFLQQLKSNKG
jgi:Na+-transporting NADH:ubiquinone oxidoreductase subunit C